MYCKTYFHNGRHGGRQKKIGRHVVAHGGGQGGRHGRRHGGRQKENKLADMELDMVANKEVKKVADVVAGHGCWLIRPKLFRPKLTRPACLLRDVIKKRSFYGQADRKGLGKTSMEKKRFLSGIARIP